MLSLTGERQGPGREQIGVFVSQVALTIIVIIIISIIIIILIITTVIIIIIVIKTLGVCLEGVHGSSKLFDRLTDGLITLLAANGDDDDAI